MSIYALSQPAYRNMAWCSDKIAGLVEECAKKRIKCVILDSEDELVKYKKEIASEFSSFVIFPSTVNWLKTIIKSAKPYNLNVISISPQRFDFQDYECSSIMCDLQRSTETAISLLQNLGRKNILLYGSYFNNPRDITIENHFKQLTGGDAIECEYYLSDCLPGFAENIKPFDAVLCPNDLVAISTAEHFKRVNPNWNSFLPIVGFTNTILSRLYSPRITTVYSNFREHGAAAIYIHRAIEKSDILSTISISLKEHLIIRESTQCNTRDGIEEFRRELREYVKNFVEDKTQSYMYRNILNAENLLFRSDKVDFEILYGLLLNKTYGEISEMCYVSQDTLKYRIKKMTSILRVSRKDEVVSAVAPYINTDNLKLYIESL